MRPKIGLSTVVVGLTFNFTSHSISTISQDNLSYFYDTTFFDS